MDERLLKILEKIFEELGESLESAARDAGELASPALYAVAHEVSCIDIAYHVTMADEYVRQADEAEVVERAAQVTNEEFLADLRTKR